MKGPATPTLASRTARALAWAAVVLPPALTFGFVRKYSVDVPWWDQWDFVPMLQQALEGRLQLRDLWVQHNEHRIVVPRLVMLALARASHWDVRWEMYLGVILLMGTGAILIRQQIGHWSAPWPLVLSMVPVSLVLFSWRQWDNLLWGWQVTFFLCLFCAVAALRLVVASRPPPIQEAGAMVLAAASTYSLSAGLCVWPVGLLLIWLSGDGPRSIGRMVRWTAAGAFCVASYLWGYTRPGHHPSPLYLLHEPRVGAEYFLVLLGSPLEDERRRCIACGAVLVAFTVFAIVTALRRQPSERTTMALGLIAFSGLTAGMITVGRSGFGDVQAQSVRYVTLVNLLIVGVYLLLLVHGENGGRLAVGGLGAYLGVVLGGVLFIQPVAGDAGRFWRNTRLAQQKALRCYETATDGELAGIFHTPARIRTFAPVLKEYQLSALRRPCPDPQMDR